MCENAADFKKQRRAAGSKVVQHLHDGGNLSEGLHAAASEEVSGVNTSSLSPFARTCGGVLRLQTVHNQSDATVVGLCIFIDFLAEVTVGI